ncbi:hypothetical protein M011DRAFT_386775, partial [Sporormia fimetaria CBS 119925]
QMPEAFLEGAAPNPTKQVIDWEGMPEYKDRWAVILDGVLTQEECDTLITAVEATTDGYWERAMVNTGGGMQMMYEEIRKCGRTIIDDRDLAARIWARVEPSVPEIHTLQNRPHITGMGPVKRKEVWKVTRLNERLRFLKYTGGEYFRAHGDGCYETPDFKERSYITLQLYLNDGSGKHDTGPVDGGATTFFGDYQQQLSVAPKVGRVLLFQHRDLVHAGDELVSGTKFTMRTDVMYTLDAKAPGA